MANVVPDGAVHVTARSPSTRSSAPVVKLAGAPDGPVASRVMSGGSDNAGAVVSTTVTVKLAVAVFPAESVARQSTRF